MHIKVVFLVCIGCFCIRIVEGQQRTRTVNGILNYDTFSVRERNKITNYFQQWRFVKPNVNITFVAFVLQFHRLRDGDTITLPDNTTLTRNISMKNGKTCWRFMLSNNLTECCLNQLAKAYCPPNNVTSSVQGQISLSIKAAQRTPPVRMQFSSLFVPCTDCKTSGNQPQVPQTESSLNATFPSTNDEDQSMSSGTIAAVVISVVFGILLLMAIALSAFLFVKLRRSELSKPTAFNPPVVPLQPMNAVVDTNTYHEIPLPHEASHSDTFDDVASTAANSVDDDHNDNGYYKFSEAEQTEPTYSVVQKKKSISSTVNHTSEDETTGVEVSNS